MTLPKAARTVEQRWGVNGEGATEINDLKLCFSVNILYVCTRVCLCVRVETSCRAMLYQKDVLV